MRRKATCISLFLTFTLFIATAFSGCNDKAVDTTKTLRVVTTTTMLCDLAKSIGKEHIEVESLMGPGVDPHGYQASAGDVTKMQNADLVIYNGLHLEGKMGDIFASLNKQDKHVACIEKGLTAEQLMPVSDDKLLYDPHVWFDVSLWKEAAVYLQGELTRAAPEHKAYFSKNTAAYLKELDQLDQDIKSKVNLLAPEQRILITAHDAFRYFGNAYGFEVKGLQGISTAAEAGTADVSALAEYIVDNKVNAIFVESSISPKTIEALKAAVISKGFAVSIGGQLYSDSLGDEDSGAQTYILTVKANVDTIVEGLL